MLCNLLGSGEFFRAGERLSHSMMGRFLCFSKRSRFPSSFYTSRLITCFKIVRTIQECQADFVLAAVQCICASQFLGGTIIWNLKAILDWRARSDLHRDVKGNRLAFEHTILLYNTCFNTTGAILHWINSYWGPQR